MELSEDEEVDQPAEVEEEEEVEGEEEGEGSNILEPQVIWQIVNKKCVAHTIRKQK